MSKTFEQAYAHVRKWEGGFSNHPNDSGGKTIAGITQRYNPKEYNAVMGMLSAGNKVGAEAYIKNFYLRIYTQSGAAGLEAKDPALAFTHFDMAVNAGISRANKILAQSGDSAKAYNDNRESFYRSISKGKNSVFLKGWLNRLNDARKFDPNDAPVQYDQNPDVSGANSPASGSSTPSGSGTAGGRDNPTSVTPSSSPQGSGGSGGSGQPQATQPEEQNTENSSQTETDNTDEPKENELEEELNNLIEGNPSQAEKEDVTTENQSEPESGVAASDNASVKNSTEDVTLGEFIKEYLEVDNPKLFITINELVLSELATMQFETVEDFEAAYNQIFSDILKEMEPEIYAALVEEYTAQNLVQEVTVGNSGSDEINDVPEGNETTHDFETGDIDLSGLLLAFINQVDLSPTDVAILNVLIAALNAAHEDGTATPQTAGSAPHDDIIAVTTQNETAPDTVPETAPYENDDVTPFYNIESASHNLINVNYQAHAEFFNHIQTQIKMLLPELHEKISLLVHEVHGNIKGSDFDVSFSSMTQHFYGHVYDQIAQGYDGETPNAMSGGDGAAMISSVADVLNDGSDHLDMLTGGSDNAAPVSQNDNAASDQVVTEIVIQTAEHYGLDDVVTHDVM